MAQPTIPVMQYNLASEVGTTWAAHVDANFETLVESTTEIINNLALIQRDDGGLRNQTVTADSFDSSALVLMAGSSISSDVDWRPMGDWATATLYRIGNIIETGSPAVAYAAAVQHTSGVFATDYAAGKWVVVSSPRTLIAADITSALGYTPVNIAGDTMTGALIAPTGTQIAGLTFTNPLLVSDELVSIDKGLYSSYESSNTAIAYGMASNVVRGAGNFLAVGGQFSAWGAAATTEAMFGANTAAGGLSPFLGALIGLEVDVASYNPSNTNAKWGLNLVFFDRYYVAAANPGQYSYDFPNAGTYSSSGSGLGNNFYNLNAIAIAIDSQSRSATGEYCGWTRGIRFGEYCLDSERDTAFPGERAYPIGIDFSEIHYYGGSDPVLSYNLEAAIALRDFQNIWWNRTPADAPTAINQVRTFFNSATGRWSITNNGFERFGFDVSTGDIYQNGAISGSVSLAGNNVWTGTNTFQNTLNFAAAGTIEIGSTPIRGDFSNATIASRSYFQSSTLNGVTELLARPNGTNDQVGISVVSDSAAANGNVLRMSVDSASGAFELTPIGAGAAIPFIFYNNLLESFRIQTTGKLSVGTTSAPSTGSNTRFLGPVEIDNPVAFSVRRNGGAGFTCADSTNVAINWTNENFDTNNSFDLGTDRFTPPAGKYLMTGNCNTTPAGAVIDTVIIVSLWKNGARFQNGPIVNVSRAVNSGGSHGTWVVDSNGTDYWQLYVAQANPTATNVDMSSETYDTFFEGYKIG